MPTLLTAEDIILLEAGIDSELIEYLYDSHQFDIEFLEEAEPETVVATVWSFQIPCPGVKYFAFK